MPIESTFTVFRDLVTDTLYSWHLPKLFHEDAQLATVDMKASETGQNSARRVAEGNGTQDRVEISDFIMSEKQSPLVETVSDDKENDVSNPCPPLPLPAETPKPATPEALESDATKMINATSSPTPIPIIPTQGKSAPESTVPPPPSATTEATNITDSKQPQVSPALNLNTNEGNTGPAVVTPTPRSASLARYKKIPPSPPLQSIEIKPGQRKKDKRTKRDEANPISVNDDSNTL
jgi:hypothetical protein